MGGSTAVHVIALTVGGNTAVEFPAVPRGQTSLDKAGRRADWIIALTGYCVGITLLCSWRGAGASSKQTEKREKQGTEGIYSATDLPCAM